MKSSQGFFFATGCKNIVVPSTARNAISDRFSVTMLADLLQQKISQLLPTPPGSDSAGSDDAKKHPRADRVLVEHDDKLGDGVQCVGGKKVLHVELRD